MSRELVPRTELIVGDEERVIRSLDTLVRNHHLLTPPRDVRLARLPDGKVATRVTILTLPPLPWRKRNPLLFGSLVAFGISVVVAGIAWMIYRAVTGVIHALGGPASLGALVIAGALLLALLANRSNHSGACPGVAVHCTGCKGHKR